MDEKELLRRIRKGDTDALQQIIDGYSGYVYAIVKNIIQPPLQPEDIEEVVSDVFLRLWEKVETVDADRLRSWLAAVTRNRAKDKLRALHLSLPLEEDVLTLAAPGPEEAMGEREQADCLRAAVLAMEETDRDIFLRHYYLCQTVAVIARDLDMNPSTVKARLRRGREKLKKTLREGGFLDEDQHF